MGRDDLSEALYWAHSPMSSQRHLTMTRSISSPVISQKMYLSKFDNRLIAGDDAHASSGAAAHLPGYRGHIPGYHFENASLGSSFGSASSILEVQLRKTPGFAPPKVMCPLRGGEVKNSGRRPCRMAAGGGPWTGAPMSFDPSMSR